MRVKDLLISENHTVLYAMERLDKVAKKVLFVQKNGKLLASITDGDVRRWILRKGSLDSEIKNVANYNPKYLINATQSEALMYMRKEAIEALPILDNEGKIQSVVLWNEGELYQPIELIDIPVVMMAGGLGTRLQPYTNILPKPLIPIGEMPISEHIINQFYKYGCKEYYLIVNHKKNMIKAYFNEIDKEYNIHYIDENEPLGTGGGLSLLKGKINQTFILTNCDILVREDFSKIYKYHKENSNVITMVCSLKRFSIPYGVVEIGKDGGIEAIKEKPTMSFFTNTGCYIVEPEIINELEYNKKIDFPQIIEKYEKNNKRVGVYPIGENSWLDMGQMDELSNMLNKLNEG